MAFFSKFGNMLKQTTGRKINNEFSASRPSIYQAIRFMSSSKLFVGGISYQTDDTSLREAFSKYGEVMEARIIVDRETGRSRGFGFVTYTSPEDASSAIQALDGQDLHGRRVRVNFANDRPRGGGGFGGGYGAGGGGFGGGGGYGAGGGGYGGGSSYGGGGSYGGSGGFGNGGGNYGGSGDYDSGNAGVKTGSAGGVNGTGWDDYVQGSGSGAGNYANESGANENTSFDVGAGGYDGQQSGSNFQDDVDDFAKRA